jgi:hypothetical protein
MIKVKDLFNLLRKSLLNMIMSLLSFIKIAEFFDKPNQYQFLKVLYVGDG